MSRLMDDDDPRTRYPWVCPVCQEDKYTAAKSMGMEMGSNHGHISCQTCKTFLHLRLVPDLDGDRMEAQEWEAYLASLDTSPAPDEAAA